MLDALSLAADLAAIRKKNPLVLSITNNVVTNTTANALLALGASPAMSHAQEEMEELPAYAGAIVLNIGTPAREYIEAMLRAAATASRLSIPLVLDPVAAGVTRHRDRILKNLLDDFPMAIIRGNASEIKALAGEAATAKGADSAHGSFEAVDAAKALARSRHTVVCVSGETDVITDGERVVHVHGGHVMMTKVTGLGCTASALAGAYAAVNRDCLAAAAHAAATMKIAGGLAAAKAAGPGTLQLHFYDALYALTPETLAAHLSLHEVNP